MSLLKVYLCESCTCQGFRLNEHWSPCSRRSEPELSKDGFISGSLNVFDDLWYVAFQDSAFRKVAEAGVDVQQ